MAELWLSYGWAMAELWLSHGWAMAEPWTRAEIACISILALKSPCAELLFQTVLEQRWGPLLRTFWAAIKTTFGPPPGTGFWAEKRSHFKGRKTVPLLGLLTKFVCVGQKWDRFPALILGPFFAFFWGGRGEKKVPTQRWLEKGRTPMIMGSARRGRDRGIPRLRLRHRDGRAVSW